MSTTGTTPDDADGLDHTPTTASARWYVSTDQLTARKRYTALFRRVSDGWVLQHVRSVHHRQQGPPPETTLKTDVSPDELPAKVFRKTGIDRNDVRDTGAGPCPRTGGDQ